MSRYEDPADGLLAGSPDASLDSRHPKEEEGMKAPRKGKLHAVPDTPDIPPPVEGWAQVSGEPVVWTGGFTTSGQETPEGELVDDYGGKTRAQEATDSMMMLGVVFVVSLVNLALIVAGIVLVVWLT